MIGSDEMSSTSMDISETFRPEDLSKTDFFDFVTAPDMGNGIGVGDRPPGSNDTNGQGDQALQGYDQFWSSDKDPNRLESTIFEDLDRYCWQQQTQSHHSTSSTNPSSAGSSISQPTSIVGGIGNTDGQIYTLTVLNGSEPWLKRDPDAPMAPTLDLDSLLGSFPGYIKSEYVYEESGGYNTGDGTKDDLSQQQHQTQNSGGLPVTTVVTTNSTNLAQFQNNNNDWHMADNNSTDQSSAESLLRSALQGKGYSKGLHLQNGIALIPTPNTVKDEELRRALFPTEQESLSFADSTLSAPMFEDTQSMVNSPTSHHQQTQTSQPNSNAATTSSSSCTSNNNNTSHSTTAGIIVDDMFLSLETAFTDDFEKLKRIANEVQQFCTSSDYPEVIMEVTTGMPPQITQSLQVQPTPPPPPPPPQQAPPPPQPLQPEVTTSNPISTSTITTKTTAKKYKRSSLNNNNSTNNNNNNSLPNNNNSNTSPTHCNGQRKERSLHYCAICSKGFKDKYSVNVHIRTHTGEKPFACSLCGKSFRQKAHLAKHYQTHLAQKSNGNVVKSGKQASSNRPQTQSTPTQRQVSPNTSGPSLPPANGLIANR